MSSMSHREQSSAHRWLFGTFIFTLLFFPLFKASVHPWAYGLGYSLIFITLFAWCALYVTNKAHTTRSFRYAWLPISLLAFSQIWVFVTTLDTFHPNLTGWLPEPLQESASAASSVDASASYHRLLQGLGLLAVFTLTLLLLNTKKRIQFAVLALIISGVAQAMYGGLMTLSGIEYNLLFEKEAYRGRATGTFVNRNHFAGYMELCLAVGVGYMLSTIKDDATSWRDFGRRFLEAILGNKARVRIGLIIMVAALVLTHSRMGNTAFFAALSITGLIALILGKNASRSTLVLLGSLIIIDLVVVGTFFGVEKVIDRIEKTTAETLQRDDVNQLTLPLLEEHGLTGTGAGSFYTVFPQVRTEAIIPKFFDHTHNDYLQFALEFGWIGFIPLLAFVLACFVAALWAQWKRKDPLMRGLSFSAMMAIIAFGIHSTVDFNLQIPANSVTFVFILALGWISCFFQERKKRSPSSQF